ncbi:MAG TPA: isochorismatase family protein [Anaerolineales bacterium]|nr:isochorismatase family protein [Anaerolineales bacterium]
MATIREGSRAILLVVDVQVEVMRNAWEADRVIHNISLMIEKARRNRIPVIWVQHSDEELEVGTPGWQIVPELIPENSESIIHKHFNSSFEETSLEETLTRLGAARIVLAGAATNWCIRATAYAALERGYDLILISDAHTTESIDFDDGATIKAEDIVGELNVAMNWLIYPGRLNRICSAQDLNFAIK